MNVFNFDYCKTDVMYNGPEIEKSPIRGGVQTQPGLIYHHSEETSLTLRPGLAFFVHTLLRQKRLATNLDLYSASPFLTASSARYIPPLRRRSEKVEIDKTSGREIEKWGVEMSLTMVKMTEEVWLTCVAHSLSTESEEIMGVLLGDIQVLYSSASCSPSPFSSFLISPHFP